MRSSSIPKYFRCTTLSMFNLVTITNKEQANVAAIEAKETKAKAARLIEKPTYREYDYEYELACTRDKMQNRVSLVKIGNNQHFYHRNVTKNPSSFINRGYNDKGKIRTYQRPIKDCNNWNASIEPKDNNNPSNSFNMAGKIIHITGKKVW